MKTNVISEFIVIGLLFSLGMFIAYFTIDWHYYKPLSAIFLFSFLFLVTFVQIARRDPIFGLFYCVLYVYTVFTQIAYVVYPEYVSARSGDQYYGLDAYYLFILFVSLSFLAIYLFSFVFFGKKHKKKTYFTFRRIGVRTSSIYQYLFLAIILFHDAIMLYFLVRNYSALNYYTEKVLLKGNKLFFFGFSFYRIILMVLYVKLTRFSNTVERYIYSVLFPLSLAIFLAISIRAGQRISMTSFLLGFTMYVFLSSPAKFGHRMKRALLFAPLLLAAFLLQNMIRTMRGSPISPFELVRLFFASPDSSAMILLRPELLMFQDYTGPSLLLLTSMANGIIFPLEVIKSNFFNSLIFTGYPGLGDTLSRIVDPLGEKGYGYYFLTEGYNMAGWLGILYNGLVFTAGISLWQKFASSDSKIFNNFMIAVISMHVFNIVRGQGCFFIKGTYFSFLPAIVLFLLASKLRIKFGKATVLNARIMDLRLIGYKPANAKTD